VAAECFDDVVVSRSDSGASGSGLGEAVLAAEQHPSDAQRRQAIGSGRQQQPARLLDRSVAAGITRGIKRRQ